MVMVPFPAFAEVPLPIAWARMCVTLVQDPVIPSPHKGVEPEHFGPDDKRIHVGAKQAVFGNNGCVESTFSGYQGVAHAPAEIDQIPRFLHAENSVPI